MTETKLEKKLVKDLAASTEKYLKAMKQRDALAAVIHMFRAKNINADKQAQKVLNGIYKNGNDT